MRCAWNKLEIDPSHSDSDSPHLKNLRRLRYAHLSSFAVKRAAESQNFRGLYLLELGIRQHNYNRPPVNESDEKALRAALPDAAIRFE